MKFDPAKDMEFYAKYAHTLLENNLPDEVTFVIICAVPNYPIHIKSNTTANAVMDLLGMGWHTTSDYITSHQGDQPATTEQKQ